MNIVSIKEAIDQEIAKNIFGNIDNAKNYLLILDENGVEIKTKMNKGNVKINLENDEIWKIIVATWDYELAKRIIRDMYRETAKYKRGKESLKLYKQYIEAWKRDGLGLIDWPYQASNYDNYVQHINNSHLSQEDIDKELARAGIQYGRIKQINTARNDYIEYKIFEANDDLIPTLQHRKGVDFYINGKKYDQKVAKSPTKQFKEDFEEDWKNKARENPALVAEYLYKHQDAKRFDADSRLLIVSIDEEIDLEQGYDWKLGNPHKISFTYADKQYSNVECFVIILIKDNIDKGQQ